MQAILGGTFDPVHSGHLHAARAARAALNVSSVTLLLAARPGHRAEPAAGVEERWRMLSLATRNHPDLLASALEIARPGRSYTVDTLHQPCASEPVVWLIGRDALNDMPTWHRALELPSLCHLLVLERPGTDTRVSTDTPVASIPAGFELVYDIGELRKRACGAMYCLADAMLDISASHVRRTIARGGDASTLLPRDVWSYIKDHGLYASGATEQDRPAGVNDVCERGIGVSFFVARDPRLEE